LARLPARPASPGGTVNLVTRRVFARSRPRYTFKTGLSLRSGGFSVLDRNRTDVTYESWEDHQLDRPMLEVLQKY
jgi:hypothetical protein